MCSLLQKMLLQSYMVLVMVMVCVQTHPLFEMVDKYVDDFADGLVELKKLNHEYKYHQHDYDAKHYNEKDALTEAEEYDFIVIGGGTSGAVIANRLSEVPEWKVLLLEAGGSENAFTKVPSLHPYMQNTPYHWQFTTVPQNNSCLGMEEHRCTLRSAKLLGGSTSTNSMVFTRGNPRDYDLWADLGNDGWCFGDVLPYFLKLEDAHIHDWDRKQHHLGGPIHIENPQEPSKLAPHLFEAAHELGVKTLDYNGKEQLGIGLVQMISKNGVRYSVGQAYLEPAVHRKNLVIRPLSQVLKIKISRHTKEAQGVQYLHEGHMYVAKAHKEIIVASGAINTPKLLKLSGIGPKDELEKHGIEHLVDLHVGYNLKEQLGFIGLNFVYNDSHHHHPEGHDDYMVNYLKDGKGPLTSPGIDALAFIKTELSKDKANYPDVELLFTPNIFNEPQLVKQLNIHEEIYDAVWKPLEHHHGFSVIVIPLHPKSSGYVKLHDSDPLHHPLINPEALSDPDDHDLDTMLAGIDFVHKLAHTEALQKLGITLNYHKVPGCKYEFATREYWTCAVKHLSILMKHPSGTARMGPEGDKTAVVDNKLRVHGVHKLRVADASVIPISISGHLTAPTIVIGEKAAELIKKEWLH